MRQLIAIIAATTVFAGSPQALAGCLSYDGRVRIEGKLVRETFPGPPNFESIKDGDKPETGWYLRLQRPICTIGGRSALTEAARHDVRRVQLILTEAQYKAERHRLNRPATVAGELWSDHTGHHHAPLLLSDVEFR